MGEDSNASLPPPRKTRRDDDIGFVTSQFVQEIDSLQATLPLAMRSIADARDRAKENADKYIADNNFERDEERGIVYIPSEHILRFQALTRGLTRIRTAQVLVPRSFFVNLVSQYDAFLGRLLRALFLVKPETLNASDRTLVSPI